MQRGKPWAVTFTGMEGQAKIEADGFDIIMDEGQKNIQNHNNNLKIYIP